MTVLQHNKLLELIQHAQKNRLVSYVQKTKAMNPLTIIANAERLQYDYFFWKHPSQSISFVGVGELYTIEADDANRFKQISNTWKRLLENSLINNRYHTVEAVGPLLFGGYSFDPIKQSTNRWRDFSPGTFILPKMMYTNYNGEGYVTHNLFPCEESSSYGLLEDIDRLYNEMFADIDELPDFSSTSYRLSEGDTTKWKQIVQGAIDEINSNNLQKVVLARDVTLTYAKQINVVQALHTLLAEQPTSYIFAFKYHQSCFIGATPEQLIQKKQDKLYTTCLAGTAPRGKTFEEDEQIADELLRDEKNKNEHQLVVNMISDAMQEVCSTTNIPPSPTIFKTKHVQHLYTPITGTTKVYTSLMDIVELLHPTPALGGYPRQESLQYIRDHEGIDRGWYASPLGWVDYSGDGEFAVAIRSALIQGRKAYLYAGCGIVSDSIPESELEETKMKLRPMLSALGGNIVE
ncbi:isochorismate synthase [Bacillus sp. HMF5848]|uniref:isochorismate synthase n=1 Tax=Bacillus sp. HMF5848 TaxID=2495421 RepID=UPI000F790BDF|nr:isochorismate synthase [Bacillus sp. HMF5848]RSK28281.1 isochorismate synthase [Bacillus sp. HMF5848]